jgi:pyruvate dehydrogenase E2 component (dihydrolipoamide acetyltransferase)
LLAKTGDLLPVGAALVEFVDGADERPEAGTVVGRLDSSAVPVRETGSAGDAAAPSRARAAPAVRALAQRLNVDLAIVTPTGPNDTITAKDVERVARILKEVGPLEMLRGVRRAMARSMAQAHAEVAPVTVNDDADLHAWWGGEQVLMLRLIRAIAAGCKVEPGLNAWYDGRAVGRRVLESIHLGVAVDTPDGLFVPVLRDVGRRTPEDLRAGLERLRNDVVARTIPPEELRGYTFILSNFGTFGGRYANPIVQPPTVAILGAGRVRDEVVAADGKPAVHPILPLSLTIDHRAVTGGEATRFLSAVIADLESSQ